jgi:hypothetical protein
MTRRIAFLFSILLFLTPMQNTASGQESSDSQVATETRDDPNAVAALTQMSLVTGWSGSAAPADVLVKATVTSYVDELPSTESVVIKARPGNKYRAESSAGRLLIVNRLSGQRVEDGKSVVLQPQTVLSLNAWVVPIYSLLARQRVSHP